MPFESDDDSWLSSTWKQLMRAIGLFTPDDEQQRNEQIEQSLPKLERNCVVLRAEINRQNAHIEYLMREKKRIKREMQQVRQKQQKNQQRAATAAASSLWLHSCCVSARSADTVSCCVA